MKVYYSRQTVETVIASNINTEKVFIVPFGFARLNTSIDLAYRKRLRILLVILEVSIVALAEASYIQSR